MDIMGFFVSADFLVPLVSSNEADLFPVFVLGAFSGTQPRKWRTLILQHV